MANKLYAMEQLTEEVAKDVSANPQEWIRFLNTASRLYRYTFPEQPRCSIKEPHPLLRTGSSIFRHFLRQLFHCV